MNKSAIIRTQLIRQLKALLLFLIFYCIVLGSALIFNEYGFFSLDFEYINYLFIIYLVVTNWLIFSKSLLFYSYQSFGRLAILNRTVIVQFIISVIASMLLEGHYLLMNFVSGVSNSHIRKVLKGVYIDGATSNEYLQSVLIIITTTLVIFCLLLLTDLALLVYTDMKKKKAIAILLVIVLVGVAIFISLPYWPDSFFDLVVTGGRYVIGLDTPFMLSLFIPIIISIVIGIIAYLLSRKCIREIEVHQSISN